MINNINTDFIIKFTNKNSKLNTLKFVKIYQSLISKKEQDIISQCYDFSFLSADTKAKLDMLYLASKSKNHDLNDDSHEPVYDNFMMIKKLIKRKNNPKKDKFGNCVKNKRKFDLFDDDEVFTYSIAQTRALLYLCNKANILPIIKIHLEEIDIYKSVYTPQNIKSVVNDLHIDYISIKV